MQAFNEKTSHLKEVPIPVNLTAFENRTFEFKTKTPPTTWFLKQCAKNGRVSVKAIYEIAKIKLTDEHLKHLSEKSMCSQIAGTAASMDLQVIE